MSDYTTNNTYFVHSRENFVTTNDKLSQKHTFTMIMCTRISWQTSFEVNIYSDYQWMEEKKIRDYFSRDIFQLYTLKLKVN